jgi:hypothetical protein
MITTTRFSNETWRQNMEYRKRYQFKGCIYGSSTKISEKIIPFGVDVFVIEMNNTLNRIEGIGRIRNRIDYDNDDNDKTPFKIYEKQTTMHFNFNKIVYRGRVRINRDYIEEENPELLEILDHILFKGKTHVKRGIRITRFPPKLFTHEKCNNKNIEKEIKILFHNYILCQMQMQMHPTLSHPHPLQTNQIQKTAKTSLQSQT